MHAHLSHFLFTETNMLVQGVQFQRRAAFHVLSPKYPSSFCKAAEARLPGLACNITCSEPELEADSTEQAGCRQGGA